MGNVSNLFTIGTSRLRLLCSAVAVVLLTGLVAVLLPQGAAQAAYGCSGAWVSRHPLNDIDGQYVASIERYEGTSSSDCYALVSRGQYAGISKYMSFTVCDGGTAASCHSNSGNFGSYAGPISTPTFCTTSFVIVRDPGGRTILHRAVYVGSCN